MRSLKEINSIKNIAITNMSFDGGTGYFLNGSLKDATVIWSYAGGWEHVSVCPKGRTPTWDEMCMVKEMFWGDDEAVIQIHPPKVDYVNNMANCLHLWKPIEKYTGKLPLPPSIFVGNKECGVLG